MNQNEASIIENKMPNRSRDGLFKQRVSEDLCCERFVSTWKEQWISQPLEFFLEQHGQMEVQTALEVAAGVPKNRDRFQLKSIDF